MRRTDTVIVGGGQAGLAMSRCLSDQGVDHVVFERGRLVERWRSERWDSLRLLTPNWQTRLPGYVYEGPDPDGFMTAAEVVSFLERFAATLRAPVYCDTAVTDVRPRNEGFHVTTTAGEWQARSVVIATGDCATPLIPAVAGGLSPELHQLAPAAYRRPEQLPDGGVLVVGASSSGIQLADELCRAGRAVVLATGHHTRVPRRYRDRDIMWWFDRAGLMNEGIDDVHNLTISREQPSLQLVGRPDHSSLDLAMLQERGVLITGRLLSADRWTVSFDDDLIATTVASDAKLAMLLARLDGFARHAGLDGEVGPPEPFVPIWPQIAEPPASLDLRAAGIRTVIWAVGYRRRYPWLRVPVLDARGEVRHEGGVTPYPGLYVLGLRFLRRRNSTFIDGVGRDAVALAAHLGRYLGTAAAAAVA
ncbi:MAG: NAD(P)-binding domain-containing protein [Vicinamibacterales bacterium]